MEKEFVPYEQALALKELGFDEECIELYSEFGHFMYNHLRKKSKLFTNSEIVIINKNNPIIKICTAPLYQQAFRWFREEYGIFSSIWIFETEQKFFIEFGFGIQKFEVKDKENDELECLKKLIEIVKNK